MPSEHTQANILPPTLRRAIIIIGSARSGTTILGSTLAQHSSLAYAEEPRMVWRYANDRRSDLLQPDQATPEVIQHIRTWFDQFVTNASRHRLLEKSPSNALRLGFVDRVLPDCQFIHIMRNGIDSVLAIRDLWQRHAHGLGGVAPGRMRQRLSELDLRRLPFYAIEFLRRLTPAPLRHVVGHNVWGPRIPALPQLRREMDLLDVCCLQWRMCTELARHYGRSLPSNRYFEIKLEELNEENLCRLVSFCGLEVEAAMMEFFRQRFDPSRASRRISTATAEERRRILTWIEPTMHWLGYEY